MSLFGACKGRATNNPKFVRVARCVGGDEVYGLIGAGIEDVVEGGIGAGTMGVCARRLLNPLGPSFEGRR